ncbi:group II intron reverse transcriptase/maturase [Bacillus cereus]|uniref:reverse transcriptase domain-containing protein n=1 Tax=Bacillus cereus TaxID=1396 RepID=UPI001D134A4C|nr:reverse transcriptase/maturase family protein [Bacillus cereus]MCC3688890.1 group II intron reverse transcriptase/maturase [Bacillus cereus]
MRNPEAILNNLSQKAKDKEYKFKRLYRNLYNKGFYLLAYSRLAPKVGNMTEGSDGKNIDGMSIKRIENLIESMRDESYQPKPSRRKFIAKATGGKRPLGIPSFNDKLIQEVIRLTLEAIYEESFLESSHGFRPNKSCHTALNQVQRTFMGVKWFIEGDIKGFFDNINHHILLNILRRRIEDEKFLRLIWKFLRAGYVEEWRYHNTYSGTPQGGIVSPILSNIYLNELDEHMEKQILEFNKGKARKTNSEYIKYHTRSLRARKKLNFSDLTEEQKQVLLTQIATWEKKKRSIPHSDPMDSGFKRLTYVRYADDFIIGVIGSKEDAVQIKKDLTVFLENKLNLELSQQKTLITHSEKKAMFLGFNLAVTRNEHAKRNKNGILVRSYTHKCRLYIPKDKWVNKLKQSQTLKVDKNGKWKPKHRPVLSHLDDIEILNLYNAEIRGMYNYYQIANNASSLHNYYYFMKYSMLKTFANKYKTSIRKIIRKYSINGNFVVPYKTKTGQKTGVLYNKGFKRISKPNKDNALDTVVNMQRTTGYTSLIERLLASNCEWCHQSNIPLEVHHVRKLKDLKGKKQWEKLMIVRKRKTLILCIPCHQNLHKGTLD